MTTVFDGPVCCDCGEVLGEGEHENCGRRKMTNLKIKEDGCWACPFHNSNDGVKYTCSAKLREAKREKYEDPRPDWCPLPIQVEIENEND